LMETG